MDTAKVTFLECIQNSQESGSTDEHMVSRVVFSLEIGGRTYPRLHVDIKQTVGASFETGPLEVGPPQGYRGPFNQSAFRDAVEKYYRGLIGSAGTVISVEGAVKLHMRDNRFVRQQSVEFPVAEGGAGW